MSLRKPADRCFSAAVLSQMQRGAVVEGRGYTRELRGLSLASAGAAECWKATTDATRRLDQVKGERSKLAGDWGCRFEMSPALVEKHIVAYVQYFAVGRWERPPAKIETSPDARARNVLPKATVVSSALGKSCTLHTN